MRLTAWLVLAGVLLPAPAFFIAAQVPATQGDGPATSTAEVSFQFDREGLAVPRFTLQLREDGSGRYQAEQAARPSSDTSVRGEEAKHIDRTIQLSSATVEKIFKTARELNRFDMDCTSKLKNIADTGKKTLSYSGADGRGSCVYHFSENKKIEMLTDTFIAIAYTMDEGGKLAFLHRYDRLGLDAEMILLNQEVDAGRALELGTIAPTLAAIADDTAVIQRARLRAAKLIEQSK
jgi:hypothetical protein